jgi:cytochrome d ubiquinol oxidase subunit I
MLSRLQFAFTIGFHILWPAYTIGVCGFYLWRRQHLEFAGAGFSAA